jgi:hypothetical protein
MRVQVLSYNYLNGEKEPVQGNAYKVNGYRKNGYHVTKGGNGSYWMNKRPELLLTYKVEGEEEWRQNSVRRLIEMQYGLDNATKEDLERFYKDCLEGKVVLEYDDTVGLYLNNSKREF